MDRDNGNDECLTPEPPIRWIAGSATPNWYGFYGGLAMNEIDVICDKYDDAGIYVNSDLGIVKGFATVEEAKHYCEMLVITGAV